MRPRPRPVPLLCAAALALAGCRSMAVYEPLISPVDVLDLRLPPCPQSPNCVSSQAWDPDQQVAPFTFAGDAADALAALEALVVADPSATIAERRSGIYVRAEYRSRVFGFVDDLELLADEEGGLIHVRSASRRGWYDLGVNRRRIERLHEQFDRSLLPIP